MNNTHTQHNLPEGLQIIESKIVQYVMMDILMTDNPIPDETSRTLQTSFFHMAQCFPYV